MEMTSGGLADELGESHRDFGEYLANYVRVKGNMHIADMEEAILEMATMHWGSRSESG